jgi:SRSO17 transposase
MLPQEIGKRVHRTVDRLNYPRSWTDDPARMKAAHVPAETRLATKPAKAGAMIARALAAQAPFGWVAADSVYGVSSLETMLRRAGKGYALGVSSDHRVNSWDKERPVEGAAWTVAQALSPSDWVRLSTGEGTKARAFMIGPIGSWPFSTSPTMTPADPV